MKLKQFYNGFTLTELMIGIFFTTLASAAIIVGTNHYYKTINNIRLKQYAFERLKGHTEKYKALIVENDIPVNFAIMNNNHLGMITQWQELFFNKDYKANAYTANPDFAKLANAFGMKSRRVEKQEDLKDAIREAEDHTGPFLIDFIIKKEENVYPMIPSGQSIEELLEEPI